MNRFHGRKVGRIDVVFLHLHQVLSVNLLRSKPAPQFDPVDRMTNKIRLSFYANLLFTHVLAEFPFSKQEHDLVHIEVREIGCHQYRYRTVIAGPGSTQLPSTTLGASENHRFMGQK